MSKFRTKNWIQVNDGKRGTYNTINRCKFKTRMIKSRLYALVKGSVLIQKRV